MKKLILLYCIFFSSKISYSQTVADNFSTNGFADAYDSKGKPFTSKNLSNIDGTPMLNDGWELGQVTFKSGPQLTVPELQFNLFTNQLYFRKDSVVYFFAEPVSEFKYQYRHEGKNEIAFFRSGYPANGAKDENTFYRVIADGNKLQLLKFSYKSIQENYVYNGPQRQIFRQMDEWFVYDVKKAAFIKFKMDKKYLLKVLPDYANAIDQFSEEKKYKLHSEAEISELFDYLNK